MGKLLEEMEELSEEMEELSEEMGELLFLVFGRLSKNCVKNSC